MTGWIADLRHAYLVYRSTPIATATVAVAMAVAMAFVSAFLSMWNDLSLKPPEGFQGSGRLVTIGQSGGYAAADGSTPLTLEIVENINESVNSLQFAAGVASFSQMLHQDDRQIPVQAEAVTRHFSDLRPQLELGRLFDEQDHARESQPAVILSYRLWQDRFDGRADIIGETLRISEAAVETWRRPRSLASRSPPVTAPVGVSIPAAR